MKKLVYRSAAFLILLTLLVSAFATTAFAIDPIDLNADVSLTVTLKSGETAIPGAEFSLYQVAEIDQFAAPTLLDSFSDFSGKLSGTTAAEWDAIAQTLAKLVAEHKLAASANGKTDADGAAAFTDGLKPGYYLVLCKDTKIGKNTYSACPALVCLPNRDDDSEVWSYDVRMNAKAGEPEPDPVPPTPPKPVPPHLPQTGLLWWPVPVLLICGLLFVVIGLTRRKACPNEE